MAHQRSASNPLLAILVPAASWLSGCLGVFEKPHSQLSSSTNAAAQAEAPVCTGADLTLRQLSRSELNGSLQLIAGDTTQAALSMRESISEGFFYNNRAQQFLNNARVSDLENTVIGPVVDALIVRESALPVDQRKVLNCDLSQASCTTQVITQFGRVAWRRSLTASEVSELVALANGADATKPVEGLRWALRALLLSPDFLFHIESGAPQDTLDGPTLATRLSLALWGTVPDLPLLDAAAAGALATDDGYEGQVARLLADPRLVDHYLTDISGNWLATNGADPPVLSGSKYTLYTAAAPSMAKETAAFLRYVLDTNAPLQDLLTANYTFVDPPLAKFYGVGDVSGSDMQKVILPNERSGLLSQGLIMAKAAGPRNPIFRGVWVFKRLMCRVLVRPDNVPPIVDPPNPNQSQNPSATLAEHRSIAQCSGCHSQIDPVGLTLEQLDNGTNLQTTYDDGTPVEDTQTLFNGKTVTGVRGLAESLNTQGEFDDCAIQQISAYAFGSGPTTLSKKALAVTKESWAQTDKGLKDVLAAVVRAQSFKTVCGAIQ
jgi:hypothetical protein